MAAWTEVRDAKLAAQKDLLKPYLISEDLVPTIEELNDVSDFIDSSDLLSADVKSITNRDIPELLNNYETGALKAVEVVEAFCRRATLAHQLTNCITEVRFVEALKEAKELDKFYAKNKKLKGPLHGIVISMKDNINVAGLASSMGFVGIANDVKKDDSAFAKLLKSLGGIIICKTNTSAGMIYSETTNVMWGRTYNPFSRQFLNVGGSSGGEGALGALKGSCFGVGSDIGGSVRHPAALNMLYSLKPSSGRFPKYGTVSGQAGQESIVSIYGVMSHYMSNLKYVSKAIVDADPSFNIDASCIPLPYRPVELPKKMNIGFMKSDGLTTVTAPMLRALELVKEKLREEGHNVFDWDATYFKEIRDTIYPFYGADGSKGIKAILEKSGEPADSHMDFLPNAKDTYVSDLWKSHQERAALAQKYFELWNTGASGERLDAVISVCAVLPGCLWHKINPQPMNSVWNAIDYSAGTFPVTRCDVSIDKPIEKDSFISDWDRTVHQLYDTNLEKFDGGPVSLQMVCGKLEEEKCLALIDYVSGLL